MSQKEYADSRGFSEPYVSKLKKAGKIAFTPDGKVNVEATDMILNATRDPSRGGDRRPGAVPPPASQPDGDGSAPSSPAGRRAGADGDGTYNAAATRERVAKARIAELELAELAGQLVRRDQVDRVVFDVSRQAMDALLTLSDRLAPAVAAETDAFRCAELINAEVREILKALAAREISARLSEREAA